MKQVATVMVATNSIAASIHAQQQQCCHGTVDDGWETQGVSCQKCPFPWQDHKPHLIYEVSWSRSLLDAPMNRAKRVN